MNSKIWRNTIVAVIAAFSVAISVDHALAQNRAQELRKAQEEAERAKELAEDSAAEAKTTQDAADKADEKSQADLDAEKAAQQAEKDEKAAEAAQDKADASQADVKAGEKNSSKRAADDKEAADKAREKADESEKAAEAAKKKADKASKKKDDPQKRNRGAQELKRKEARDAWEKERDLEKLKKGLTLAPRPSGGPTLAALATAGQVKIDSAGTGETIGHVADLKIQNITDQPLTCAIAPMILESGSGKNQHYACPSGQTVALNPHQTKTVPMNGVCLNRNKPPVGKGVSGDLVMNEANSSSPQNPNSHLPATDAGKLLRSCAAKYTAADQLQKSGALKNLPYHDPQKQKDIVVQWSTWTDPEIAQMTGSPPATKDDLKKVVYKQVEQHGPMTPEKKKKVDEGIDAIFSAVELTSAKAKDLEKPPSAQVALTGEGGKGPTIEETPPPQTTPQPESPTADHSVNPEIARQFDDSVDTKGCQAVSCGTFTKVQGVKGNTIVTCPGNKNCTKPCACFVYEAPANDKTARWKKSHITLAGEVDFDPTMDYACFCTN